MTPREWTLLVLAAAEANPLQPVHLQKSLFLLGKRLSLKQLGVEKFYDFEAYDYGPFCQQVYRDAEALAGEGLVQIENANARSYREYVATSAGIERAKTLSKSLAPEVQKYVRDLVAQIRTLSFRQLISAVYKAYPEMRANSVFKD